MPFDLKKFSETPFEPRVKEVPVPYLKDFFTDEGEKPIWKIKSLNGAEMGVINELTANDELAIEILGELLSVNKEQIMKMIMQLIGRSGKKPKDVARRIYLIQFASLSDQFINSRTDSGLMPLEDAVKISEINSVLFFDLSNKILALAAEGYRQGKLPPSGKTKKSKPA